MRTRISESPFRGWRTTQTGNFYETEPKILIGLLILVLGTPLDRLRSSDGMIQPEAFERKSQIIFAETMEIESGIRGKVVKQSDLAEGNVTGDGAVDLPAELIEQYLERDVPRHQVALFSNGNEPSAQELAVATRKDDAERKAIVEKTMTVYKTAGLRVDPATETIVHFYFGRARMQVLETLKGSLKPGDEITVTWENVRHRTGCPAILPWKGKQVWMIDGNARAGGTAKWIHGYYADLKMARTARDEHFRKKTSNPGN